MSKPGGAEDSEEATANEKTSIMANCSSANADHPYTLTANQKRRQRLGTRSLVVPFPQFAKLPLELQVHVFRSALPDGTKIHLRISAKTPTGFRCSRRPLITLYINRGSRRETLKHYRILLENNKLQRHPTFFDPNIDTLFFERLCAVLHGLKILSIPGEIRESIQLVGFEHMFWLEGHTKALQGKVRTQAALDCLAFTHLHGLRQLTLNYGPRMRMNDLNELGGRMKCANEVQSFYERVNAVKDPSRSCRPPDVVIQGVMKGLPQRIVDLLQMQASQFEEDSLG